METILITTDFSNAGRNATRYGFEFAKSIQAKVILFNAWQFPSTHPESLVYLPADDLEKCSYQQLANEAEAIDPQRTVALETQSRRSPVITSILSVARENNVSYIIVGMKQNGKEIRRLFGSTVTFLKNESPVPVIVVPENARFFIPETIALASNMSNEARCHILDPLKNIAEKFKSKLYVVHVIKKFADEAVERLMISSGTNMSLKDLQPIYESPINNSIVKAMNAFVREHVVNMVAVIPQEHNAIEKMFAGSVTKNLAFNTNVPLLILPAKAPHLSANCLSCKTAMFSEAFKNKADAAR